MWMLTIRSHILENCSTSYLDGTNSVSGQPYGYNPSSGNLTSKGRPRFELLTCAAETTAPAWPNPYGLVEFVLDVVSWKSAITTFGRQETGAGRGSSAKHIIPCRDPGVSSGARPRPRSTEGLLPPPFSNRPELALNGATVGSAGEAQVGNTPVAARQRGIRSCRASLAGRGSSRSISSRQGPRRSSGARPRPAARPPGLLPPYKSSMGEWRPRIHRLGERPRSDSGGDIVP